MTKTLVFLLTATALLSGCGWYDNRTIETQPNTIMTDQGPVVCQHYIGNIVWFDRAWVKPETMTTETANALCQEEGRRLQAGGERHNINAGAGFSSAPTD